MSGREWVPRTHFPLASARRYSSSLLAVPEPKNPRTCRKCVKAGWLRLTEGGRFDNVKWVPGRRLKGNEPPWACPSPAWAYSKSNCSADYHGGTLTQGRSNEKNTAPRSGAYSRRRHS